MYVKPITLSKDFDSIELFPLSDLHIGCKEYSANLKKKIVSALLMGILLIMGSSPV